VTRPVRKTDVVGIWQKVTGQNQKVVCPDYAGNDCNVISGAARRSILAYDLILAICIYNRTAAAGGRTANVPGEIVGDALKVDDAEESLKPGSSKTAKASQQSCSSD
jgi:hypothetical protein